MNALLLSLIFFIQGVGSPPGTGTISGVIRTAAGKPAAGVRVAAMVRPASPADAASEVSSAGLAQTDEDGRYRLDNLPLGSYVIAAGRVALPTYYPGTLELSKGKAIALTSASSVVNNIDIAMDDASIRPSDSAIDVSTVAGLTLPVQVRVEGGAKQPIFANGQPVVVRFTRRQDGSVAEVPLNDSIMNLPVPGSLPGFDYRVSIENLPSGYVVKSMAQDGVDLMSDTLKITAKNFVEAQIPVYGAALPGAMLDTVRMAYGAGGPMTPLEITLAGSSTRAGVGVMVRGRVTFKGNWDLSLPGSSAVLFVDGSFECRGVAPGRHVIMMEDKLGTPARVLAASVVVGDKDLNDVTVDDVAVLPVEVRFPASTPPAGTIISLPGIHGRVSDDRSKAPAPGGAVTLVGKTRATFPIDSEGQFEIPRLLPGTYELTIESARHVTVRQNVVVGDDDVALNVLVRSSG